MKRFDLWLIIGVTIKTFGGNTFIYHKTVCLSLCEESPTREIVRASSTTESRIGSAAGYYPAPQIGDAKGTLWERTCTSPNPKVSYISTRDEADEHQKSFSISNENINYISEGIIVGAYWNHETASFCVRLIERYRLYERRYTRRARLITDSFTRWGM